MFRIDVKRIKACIEHEDYYAALLYINLIIENYTNEQKAFFELIRKNIKSANYEEINRYINLY